MITETDIIDAAFLMAMRSGRCEVASFLFPGTSFASKGATEGLEADMGIGDKPASEMTYREWLVGQALSSAMTMLEVRLLQNIGRHCVEYADSVLGALDANPNRIPLDFTAVKADSVTGPSRDDLPQDGYHPF